MEAKDLFKDKELNSVFRQNLFISALPKSVRDEFCDEAKERYNDNYSAYLIHLLDCEKNFYKILNNQAIMAQMDEDIQLLKEQVEDLRKGSIKKNNTLKAIDGSELDY